MASIADIERTVQHDLIETQLAQARSAAQALHSQSRSYIERGFDRNVLYKVLSAEFRRQRQAGNAVMRDALAEVLGAFDGETDEESAL
jgi:hypothetical protein